MSTLHILVVLLVFGFCAGAWVRVGEQKTGLVPVFKNKTTHLIMRVLVSRVMAYLQSVTVMCITVYFTIHLAEVGSKGGYLIDPHSLALAAVGFIQYLFAALSGYLFIRTVDIEISVSKLSC